MPANEDRLAGALALGTLGFRVLPVYGIEDERCTCQGAGCQRPGKHPILNSWQDNATSDAAQIANWWSKWPKANVAVATGGESGLVVLDVDPAHGGDVSLGLLLQDGGPLPQTPWASTGGGGRHYYFLCPGVPVANSVGKLGRGLDIRGDRGYVVAPPSRHASGSLYTWALGPELVVPADFPPHLFRRLVDAGSIRLEGVNDDQ